MAGIKKSNRINVKNLVYAVLEKDDAQSVEYGQIKPFGKIMQIQITPGLATGTLMGEGVKQEVISKLTGLTVVVDINKLPIDVRVEILGNTYEDGIATEKAGDEPREIALGFMVEQTGKTAEYIWLLKGRPQPYGSTVGQQEESIKFSTDSVTIEFVPREHDGELRKFADSADSDFTKEKQDAWFKTVPGSTGTVDLGK